MRNGRKFQAAREEAARFWDERSLEGVRESPSLSMQAVMKDFAARGDAGAIELLAHWATIGIAP